MKFTRLLYVVCLILSGLSFSAYADDAWQQQPGQAQPPGSNRPGGRPDASGHGRQNQNQTQLPQVEDDGGSLKIAPTDDKKAHSYHPLQSGDNEKQQNDDGKNAENNSPVVNTTSIDANKFDSV